MAAPLPRRAAGPFAPVAQGEPELLPGARPLREGWRFRLARPGTCCFVGGRLLVFFCSHLARAPHYVRLPLFICTIFMVSTGVILRFGRYEGIFYKARLIVGKTSSNISGVSLKYL